jgi:Tol biopolymer transport system component
MDSQPVWSANGDQLTFVSVISDDPLNQAIIAVDMTTGAQYRLIDHETTHNYDQAWSP